MKFTQQQIARILNNEARLDAMVEKRPFTPYPIQKWALDIIRRRYYETGELCNDHLCKEVA
jgi:hypothetical protein